MSLISPTTLLVAGSISITLSPAALVWTIRTVAACRDTAAAASASARMKGLVFIAGYFKLRSHAVDPLFHRPAAGQPRTGFRGVQGQSRAAAAREAPRPRPLRRLSLDRHGVPAAGVVARGENVERRAIAEEFRDGQAICPARRAGEEPAPDDAARARSRRYRVSSGRQALGDTERSRVQDARRLGQREEVMASG